MKTSGYVFSCDDITLILIDWFDHESMQVLNDKKIGKKYLFFLENIKEFEFSKNAARCPLDLDKYLNIEDYIQNK